MSDFFVQKDVEEKVETGEVERMDQIDLHKRMEEKKTTKKKDKVSNSKPSNNYLPIKLSSMGKLNAPSIIYVRNYTGEDVLNLSLMNDDSSLETIVQVLNNMVHGGFDCSYLHPKEIEEILLNILVNFWSSIIEYPYPYTNEELESYPDKEKTQRIRDGKETLFVTLSASELKTQPLLKIFEEPITITLKEETIQFILPRIRHMLIAQNYVEKKYVQEEGKFNDFVRGKDILLDREYDAYIQKRNKDFLMVQQAQRLIKHGSKVLNELDDQIKYFKEIGIDFWSAYNQTVEDQLQFGVNSDIEVVSPLTGEKVIRRFQFRLLEFIPSLDKEKPTDYIVTFGEQ